MARVYVSIGSNIEADKHIRSCLAALRARFGDLIQSTVYRTRPVGFEGDDFYNLVVGFDSGADVHAVVAVLRAIEDAHGRDRNGARFAPRTLDLDLLLYDDLVLVEDGLQLPRPELTRYAFVLGPLAEIAGKRRHPLLGKSYAELWAAYDEDAIDLRPVQLEQQ